MTLASSTQSRIPLWDRRDDILLQKPPVLPQRSAPQDIFPGLALPEFRIPEIKIPDVSIPERYVRPVRNFVRDVSEGVRDVIELQKTVEQVERRRIELQQQIRQEEQSRQEAMERATRRVQRYLDRHPNVVSPCESPSLLIESSPEALRERFSGHPKLLQRLLALRELTNSTASQDRLARWQGELEIANYEYDFAREQLSARTNPGHNTEARRSRIKELHAQYIPVREQLLRTERTIAELTHRQSRIERERANSQREYETERQRLQKQADDLINTLSFPGESPERAAQLRTEYREYFRTHSISEIRIEGGDVAPDVVDRVAVPFKRIMSQLESLERERNENRSSVDRMTSEVNRDLVAERTRRTELISEARRLSRELSILEPQFRLDSQDSRLRNRWPQNTQVHATSSGSQYSIFFPGDEEPNNYFNQLTRNMRTAKTFDEAIRQTERTIQYYPGSAQVRGQGAQTPMSSTPPADGGWDTRQNRPRRILIVMGDGADIAENNEATSRQIIEMARTRFGVPAENIQILRRPTRTHLTEAFENMRDFATNNDNAESMVLMLGHGRSNGLEAGLTAENGYQQGANNGSIRMRSPQGPMAGYTLQESELKELFNTYMSGFRVNRLIVDSCFAGDFLAQAPGRRDSLSASVA